MLKNERKKSYDAVQISKDRLENFEWDDLQ